MPITKKYIVFLLSLIVTILFISLFPIIIKPLIINSSQTTLNNIVIPIIFTISLIFFLFFQALIKYNLNKKIISQNKIFIETNSDKFTFSEKLWIYILIILIYFIPIIKKLSFSSMTTIRIILFIISFVIIEILLKLSQNTMKILFLKEGIIITGLDLRIDIPLGKPTHNVAAFYPYNSIDGFTLLQNGIQLFVEYEQGHIIIKTNDTKLNQIRYILKENKIEIRKYV